MVQKDEIVALHGLAFAHLFPTFCNVVAWGWQLSVSPTDVSLLACAILRCGAALIRIKPLPLPPSFITELLEQLLGSGELSVLVKDVNLRGAVFMGAIFIHHHRPRGKQK